MQQKWAIPLYLCTLILIYFSRDLSSNLNSNATSNGNLPNREGGIRNMWETVYEAIQHTHNSIKPRKYSKPVTQRDIDQRKEEWKTFVQFSPPYPENLFSGRGIAIAAGGKYMSQAIVSINVLRKIGCTLPIELWYKGETEKPTRALEQYLTTLGVACKDLHAYFRGPGYATKTLALLVSSFREVLFLDPDSLPVQNPEFLWETDEYKTTTALFWPDFWEGEDMWGSVNSNDTIWKIIGFVPSDLRTQESGQILIDKKESWSALLLTVFLNYKGAEFYYKILLGDKDTFRISWMAMNTPFYMVNYTIGSGGKENDECNDRKYLNDTCAGFHGHTMVQHDVNGNVLFLHRNLAKWSSNADVVNSYDDYTRTWEVIQEWKNCHRGDSYILMIMEFYGVRFIGDKNIVEHNFLDEVGFDVEKDCWQTLYYLKTSTFFREYLQRDWFTCLCCNL